MKLAIAPLGTAAILIEEHTPTSITFLARPYGETELIALGKTYQAATDFHRKHPNLG